jgi:hypothetical protein
MPSTPWLRRASLVAGCGAVVSLALYWKPLAVAYYQREVKASWIGLMTSGPNGSNDRTIEERQESDEAHQDYMAQFERGRNALVWLGHFEKREFPLVNIAYPSKQFSELWKEVSNKCGDSTRFADGKGYDSPSPSVVVWAPPSEMPDWEAMIKRLDIPAPK